MKGVVIAGTHSGCGKTTVTLGILAALKKKELVVQPFKAGPDFIDTGLHRLVTGKPSRNLDVWMCGADYVIDCFRRHAEGADIAVVEGVMGMYDGDFSTAALASLLDLPVVLVVDAYGMAESAGAVVQGFAEFGQRGPLDRPLRISDCAKQTDKFAIDNSQSALHFAGVIFNRVASENHYQRLKNGVRELPVLGYLPRELNFEIPHRHLGLTTAEESPLAGEDIDELADTVTKYIDIDFLRKSARDGGAREPYQRTASAIGNRQSAVKIAVAHDKAFSFYYEDNLDLLRDGGAKIIRFSPLADKAVPVDADVVYIGGGYPEIHAAALSNNASMLQSLRAWADAGKPLYAECGGFMYLSRGIRDFNGSFFPMTGVFPFETRMLKKPRLGYREILLNEACLLGSKGDTCRGHEFHYSEIAEKRVSGDRRQGAGEDVMRVYAVMDKTGVFIGNEGFAYKNTLASYIHVHFGGREEIARRFAAFVKGERIA